MDRPTVTITAPVFNEVDGVEILVRRLEALHERLPGERLEFLIVDDGSTDGTWEKLTALLPQVHGLRAVRFSRNFGHQPALSAGLELARGEAVITMDGDLQHPPEHIPEMVAAWRAGADIVYMVRDGSEKLGAFKRHTSNFFYWTMNTCSGVSIPNSAADFRLVGPKPLAALRTLRERHRLLRGLVPWLGYRSVILPYCESGRSTGQTKYSTLKMTKLFLDGIFSFSVFPLRLAFLAGTIMFGLAFCYGAYAVAVYFFSGEIEPGWTSLLLVVLLLGSTQLLTLGIVGEYIARIYDEIKDRPLYLIAEDIHHNPTAIDSSSDNN